MPSIGERGAAQGQRVWDSVAGQSTILPGGDSAWHPCRPCCASLSHLRGHTQLWLGPSPALLALGTWFRPAGSGRLVCGARSPTGSRAEWPDSVGERPALQSHVVSPTRALLRVPSVPSTQPPASEAVSVPMATPSPGQCPEMQTHCSLLEAGSPKGTNNSPDLIL